MVSIPYKTVAVDCDILHKNNVKLFGSRVNDMSTDGDSNQTKNEMYSCCLRNFP